MTVNVYAGPGTSAYQSTRYTATVNGVSSYVYGAARTSPLPVVAWSYGDTVEMSWVKFTADETTTVVITRIAGPITSAIVYPGNVATQSIAGGVLTLTVPTNKRFRIEINGDRANAMHVFSEPLPRAIGTVTNWTAVTTRTVSGINTGTNVVTCTASHGYSAGQRLVMATTGTLPAVTGTALSVHEAVYVLSPSGADLKLSRTAGGAEIDFTSAGTGTLTFKPANLTSGALYFGTGVHTISRGFKLEPNTRIYIDANAVVVGSFDWRGSYLGTITVEGPGSLWGDFAVSESLPVSLDGSIGSAMFLGGDGISFGYNSEVQGITIARAPFYVDWIAVNKYRNVQVISPWYPACNGLQVCFRLDGLTPAYDASIIDCFSHSADDNLVLGEQCAGIALTVSGCVLVTSANSNIHLNYWAQEDNNVSSTFDQIDMVHLGVADNLDDTYPGFGTQTDIKCWADGRIGEEDFGRFNCTFTNLRFWGPRASRWLMLKNRKYPFIDGSGTAPSRDQRGRIANFVFENVTHEQVPGQIAVMEGFDFYSTPHDIAFRNVSFAGERMTAATYPTFFQQNAFPYNITVGGQPVVTAVNVCNTALDLIGHSKRITSISPPDGSSEADVCAEHYTDCVNELLDVHHWNFATVKRALVAVSESDDPAWDYCYEVPEGMLRLISVIPSDATDNSYTANAAVPVDYEIHADTDDVVRIYTDLEDAWVRFVKYVESPGLFSPTFIEALQWKLASRIAGPIIKGTEGATERDRCTQQYMMAIAKATQNDARQQRQVSQTTAASWHKGR